MDDPAACREFRVKKNIGPALDLMKKYPTYCFVMENMQNLMEFMEDAPERMDEVVKYMREGRLEFGATYNQPYEGSLSGEQLVRECYFGRRWLKQQFPGCDARVAFNPDVPGRTLQMQQILKKAGIPYLVISRFHRGLWSWTSPDDSSVLAYSPGHYISDHLILKGKLERALPTIREKIRRLDYHYAANGIPRVYPLFNTVDFARPMDFSALIKQWRANAEHTATIEYSPISSFFDRIASGNPTFPVIRGERPGVWLYIHGPGHHYAMSAKRQAGVLLPAAEAFQTIACLAEGGFDNYPVKKLEQAWKDSLADDHGWGGKDGEITDALFLARHRAARDSGKQLLRDAVVRIAGRIKGDSAKGMPVTVFNDLNWKRTDLVRVPVDRAVAKSVVVRDAEGKHVASQVIDVPREVNVALATMGATASASSVHSEAYSALHAIDGQWFVKDPDRNHARSHKWNAEDSKGPHWLMVDLGQSRTVHRVVIKHEGVLGIHDEGTRFVTVAYRLQHAAAASGPWVDVCAPVTDNQSVLTSHAFTPQAMRYLRLQIDKGARADNTARIYEIEAYADLRPEKPEVVFVADAVPGLGYKTYYLKQGSPRPDKASTAEAPTVAENAHYRITLVPGGVKSIVDKQRGKELLGAEHLLGGELFTLRSVGNGAGEFGAVQQPDMEGFHKLSLQKPQWKRVAEESGPVQQVYALEQSLPTVTVRQRMVLYNSLKKIDFEAELVDWKAVRSREWRMAFPLASGLSQVAYHVPMGVVEVGKDEIPMIGGHARGRLSYWKQCKDTRPREVRDFVSANGDGVGVTLSMDVAAFDWIDPTGEADGRTVLQPILLATRKSCHGLGNWYLQAGTHAYRFSFTSHDAGWRNGWRHGVGANHSFHVVLAAPAVGGRTLPETAAGFSVTGDNIHVTAVKKAEDTNDVILRCYDMEGADVNVTVKSFKAIKAARVTNIIEEDIRPLKAVKGSLSVPVGHHAIETLRVITEQ